MADPVITRVLIIVNSHDFKRLYSVPARLATKKAMRLGSERLDILSRLIIDEDIEDFIGTSDMHGYTVKLPKEEERVRLAPLLALAGHISLISDDYVPGDRVPGPFAHVWIGDDNCYPRKYGGSMK